MNEIDKFKEACKLLQGLKVVEGKEGEEEEEEGKVTRSFLRRAFEMLEEAKGKEEYLISVGYMVARRKGDRKKEDRKKEKDIVTKKEEDIVTFYKRLIELLGNVGGEWNESKKVLKGVFEYVIKLYYIRLKLGEDLCTKP